VDQPPAEAAQEEFAETAEPPAPDDQEVTSHFRDIEEAV
jgi:hypothetical protein